MINDLTKRIFKLFASGIIWVFVLSMRIEGQPLYFYAHDWFVENALVRTVDEELTDLWQKVKHTARASFDEVSKENETTTAF